MISRDDAKNILEENLHSLDWDRKDPILLAMYGRAVDAIVQADNEAKKEQFEACQFYHKRLAKQYAHLSVCLNEMNDSDELQKVEMELFNQSKL